MKCPRCKCRNDLYRSRAGNQELSPIRRMIVVAVRCHRCGELFHTLRFSASNLGYKSHSVRRAA